MTCIGLIEFAFGQQPKKKKTPGITGVGIGAQQFLHRRKQKKLGMT